MNKEDLKEIQSMINVTNIEMETLIRNAGIISPMLHHWIDVYHKMLIGNTKQLRINQQNENQRESLNTQSNLKLKKK